MVVETDDMTLPPAGRVGAAQFTRSRSSKVQNNVITINLLGVVLRWLVELQPLAKKDADTLGLALIQAVAQLMQILRAARQGKATTTSPLRVIHLLTGDGVNTNEAASKRLYQHYHNSSCETLRYFLLVWRCASHQANLCVEIAICGRLLPEPLDQNDLCANCSRFFKYLFVRLLRCSCGFFAQTRVDKIACD